MRGREREKRRKRKKKRDTEEGKGEPHLILNVQRVCFKCLLNINKSIAYFIWTMNIIQYALISNCSVH